MGFSGGALPHTCVSTRSLPSWKHPEMTGRAGCDRIRLPLYGIPSPRLWSVRRRGRSIKIVGVEIDIVDSRAAHAEDLLGAHRDDAVLHLQHAVDDEERLFDDDE